MPNLNTLRSKIKQHRQLLSPASQRMASLKLAIRINRHPLFRASNTFSAYLAFNGEISLAPLIKLAIKNGKRCYLPVISGQTMEFREYRPSAKLIKNKFHINEPKLSNPIALQKLDLLLCPLVAFDCQGARVGMGGGYYDKMLSQYLRRGKRVWGVAHECQKQPTLALNRWDMKMDGIFTDLRVYTTYRR